MSLAYMVQIFFFDIFFFSCPWPTWVRHLEPHRAEGQSSSLHGVFYANFGKVRRPAASTGWAPDGRDRCWVRPLSCAKVLAESDQAFGREGRIADPRRQEPDVIGNATTPQIGGFYANFGKVRRPAASTGWAPDHRGRCWVRPLSCAKVLAELLLGTSSLLCESSDRIEPSTRPGGANRGPPSPRARCSWKSYNAPNRWFLRKLKSMRRQAASIGRAPDHRDRCWVRRLSCVKVLTESDQALGREGRIADPHRQEPDVIGNPTTPQIGGFYANFGKHALARRHQPGGPPITGNAAGYVFSCVRKF